MNRTRVRKLKYRRTRKRKFTRVIQKSKIKNGWERKGNHPCECSRPCHSQPRFRSQRFPIVFAFKETSVGPEVSRRLRGEKRPAAGLCAQAAEFCDIGIQNLVPRLNKCLYKLGDYVE
jgi:hypothetical protein